MFGALKRLRRKDADSDFEDIRSSVVGDFRGLPPEPQPDFPRAPAWDDPVSPPPRYNEPRFDEPPGFSSIDVRQDQRFVAQDRGDKYDILDRLNLIESQLAAIRSQTETINERLKNMERSLGRRY
ncbi:MAG: hypothetical protein HY517_03210 [Candidatus Aenigmarchaeota archaeon]|nr:hypothetical protein [Candidatus Aenigmarchaeota archaeon]